MSGIRKKYDNFQILMTNALELEILLFFLLFSHMMFIPMNHPKHTSMIEPRRLNHFGDESDQPPPLPVKKKHSKYGFILYRIQM